MYEVKRPVGDKKDNVAEEISNEELDNQIVYKKIVELQNQEVENMSQL